MATTIRCKSLYNFSATKW